MVTKRLSSVEIAANSSVRAQSLRLEANSYRPFEQPTPEAVEAIQQVIK
jgi:hypothetical protein